MKKATLRWLFLLKHLERVMGIEPTLFAWEAKVLPLNDTRLSVLFRSGQRSLHGLADAFKVVE